MSWMELPVRYAQYLMSKNKSKIEKKLTIHDLYPNLSEEQLRTAEENIERYLEIVMKIYKRIKSENLESRH